MNFAIETAVAAKMTDFDILSDKDREPDTNPGVALALTILLASECLSMFDGYLRSMLFTKNGAGQDTVSTDLPNLSAIGKALGEFGWASELTGYTMTFDHGLAGASNIVLTDCKVTAFRIFAKEGGTVQLKLKVESPNVPELVRGKLTGFKSQEVHVLFAPPEVADQEPDLAEQGGAGPRKDVKQTKGQALGAVLGHDNLEGGAGAKNPAAAWPFPTAPGKKDGGGDPDTLDPDSPEGALALAQVKHEGDKKANQAQTQKPAAKKAARRGGQRSKAGADIE